MNQALSSRMKTLVDEFGIINLLTNRLMVAHDEHPEIDRFVGWHPTWFKQEIQYSLPADKKHLLPDSAGDFSFYDELEQLPGVLTFTKTEYPALVRTLDSTVPCVLTVDYCKAMFHKVANNPNSVHELAELLEANNESVWFSLPPKVAPDEDSQSVAMVQALAYLARQNPRKYPAIVKSFLHDMGFDASAVTAKQINETLEEMVADD